MLSARDDSTKTACRFQRSNWLFLSPDNSPRWDIQPSCWNHRLTCNTGFRSNWGNLWGLEDFRLGLRRAFGAVLDVGCASFETGDFKQSSQESNSGENPPLAGSYSKTLVLCGVWREARIQPEAENQLRPHSDVLITAAGGSTKSAI